MRITIESTDQMRGGLRVWAGTDNETAKTIVCLIPDWVDGTLFLPELRKPGRGKRPMLRQPSAPPEHAADATPPDLRNPQPADKE